jgi:hypothetical protein
MNKNDDSYPNPNPTPPITTHYKMKEKSNIFKTRVPLDQFYTLIQTICPSPVTKTIKSNTVEPNETCFTLDLNAFKRGIFLEVVEPFMQMLATDYYNKRCAFYAERSMKTPSAFAHFVQVVKHVCKNNNILITSSLKYEQSQSNKVYYIHFKSS